MLLTDEPLLNGRTTFTLCIPTNHRIYVYLNLINISIDATVRIPVHLDEPLLKFHKLDLDLYPNLDIHS